MATDPVFTGMPKAQSTTFTNGMSTRPRSIWTPGASGSRVHFISAANSVASNPTLYLMEPMTLQANMSTGTHVDGGGGSDTFTRGGGSFVTDGWLVGDRMWVSGSTTLANDYLTQLTAVAALTLTFATATVNTGETLPSGGVLYRAHQLATVTGTANAGNSTSVAATNILDPTMIPALFGGADCAIFIPASWRLAVSLSAAPSSSQFVDITVMGADA